jgi:hypothetical protein
MNARRRSASCYKGYVRAVTTRYKVEDVLDCKIRRRGSFRGQYGEKVEVKVSTYSWNPVNTSRRISKARVTYSSSMQFSCWKPSPASTFSWQCWKCLVKGAHLADCSHCSRRPGRT